MSTKSKLLKDNWHEWTDYKPEHLNIGSKREMEQAKDLVDKLSFVQGEVRTKLVENIPPEQDVAMRMYLYGITVDEFVKMENHLNLPSWQFDEIAVHLANEWKNRKKK